MSDLQVPLDPAYPVRLRADFGAAWSALREDQGDRPWMIVADARVLDCHRSALRGLTPSERRGVVRLRGGESCKSPSTVLRLHRAALERKLGRDSLIVAMGGGTVGDVTGYFAATWMRGVDWCPIATTTLAMADSAIGGKTAINLDGVKNLVGSFHQPVGVYGVLDALTSLPARHRRAGLAEVIKSGIIGSKALFDTLEGGVEALEDPRDPLWLEVLRQACAVKAEVVAADPTERGRRAILNFGHTIGHALEVSHAPRLLHGEAVGLGMIAASWVSEFHGPAPSGTTDRIASVLARAGLPRKLRTVDRARFWKNLSYDKKGRAGESRMVLTPDIGSATFGHRVGRQLLQSALRMLGPRD